jgi:hypothetical protein
MILTDESCEETKFQGLKSPSSSVPSSSLTDASKMVASNTCPHRKAIKLKRLQCHQQMEHPGTQ